MHDGKINRAHLQYIAKLRQPINIYRVDRASGVRSRLHALTRSGLTPFMGREDERNTLMSRWLSAQKGKGQLVMITGEAGIGKSRLLQQFKEDLGGIPHTWIEGESSQYEQDTPFAPTLDLVSNAFQWTSDTTTEQKIEDLEFSFGEVGLDTRKTVPLIASLFGLSLPPDKFPPLLLSPEQQRSELLKTLVDWVIGTARLQPTVLVVEDLHFADPSTLEEFILLGERVENEQLMLIFTARPRFQPPWPTRAFHAVITLNRLDRENVQDMISNLLGKLVPEETLASLVERTDGNPLFAEELSQALSTQRTISTLAQQIPSTLQDLLTARLDSLGSIKEIAQIGAVLGRTFSFSLLAAIANQPEDALENALIQLVESGLVFAETVQKESIYTFKHALVQEAAYGLLLKSRRRELHSSVANVIKEKFPDLAKQRPELIAHHLTEANDTEAAVEAWQNAGDFATGRAAYAEAENHYKKALKVLENIPEESERLHMELPLQLSLANALKVTTGFGSDQQLAAYSRAKEISEKLGDSAQFLIILLGLWGTINSRSDLATSRELSAEIVRISERDQNRMMLTWAYETQAIENYGQGKFTEVMPYFIKMSEYYNTDEQAWSPFDPKVTTYIHAFLATWHIGKIEDAQKMVREQWDLTKDMQPGNVVMAHLGACSLYIHIRDADKIMENALEMIRIADENDLPSYHGWGVIYQGAAYILKGEYEKGISMLTQGVGAYLATGTHSSLAQYLSILSEGYVGMGDIEKALTTNDDAFGAMGEELMHLPELLRVRGEIFQQRGNDGDMEYAESQYRESMSVAREYGSIILELRAATRLGRLLQAKGDIEGARALVEPLYQNFTSGFDTPFLQDAKQLLDELS